MINNCFGKIDILINGAGGNHPLGTTSNPFFMIDDMHNKNEDFKTFFDLESKGIEFTFNLNFLGLYFPHKYFLKI